MKEYENIYQSIRKYFINLGYTEPMFERDTTLSNQSSTVARVDFVVMQDNQPYIIVEAKSTKVFNGYDDDELKYDPSVRQVQKYAISLEAPYYVVTNGEVFLWFKTGEDGRPCKIEPIQFATVYMSSKSNTTLKAAFIYCTDLLKQDVRTSDVMYEFTLILLARFATIEEIPPHVIPSQINHIINSYYNLDVELISQVNEQVLEECWNVLFECRLENEDPKNVIDSLKLTYQKFNRGKFAFRIGERLAKFIVSLAMISDSSIVLDPATNLGEIVSEISLRYTKNSIYAHCQSKEMYAFYLLQQKITNKSTPNIKLLSYENFIRHAYSNNMNIFPDTIVTALPFGSRTNISELRYLMPLDLTNIEDLMLVSSLQMLKTNGRLVAIVPDSMLFAGGKRERMRRFITEQYCPRGVISLPVGAISNSNIKTSIVIIDKTSNKTSNVFWGMLETTDINTDSSDSDANSILNQLFIAYEKFLSDVCIDNAENWKVAPIDYGAENLRVETYLSISDYKIHSDYPLLSVNDICISIERGTVLKLDPDGDIPVLGPASIRANTIDPSKFNRTSEFNVTRPPVYAKKNGVVFNNISSYLGAAALVEDEMPIAINQHIILITPKTNIVTPQYLAIALNSKMVNEYILKSSTGAVIPSITLSKLKDIQVPVPDLETQQKIVQSTRNIQTEIAEHEETIKTLESRLKSVIDNLAPEEE